jgi:hypothetical protein
MTFIPNTVNSLMALNRVNGQWNLADPGQMHIIKRDGKEVPYDPTKISRAVERCFQGIGYTQLCIDSLLPQITNQVDRILRIQSLKPDYSLESLNIEFIQNIVETQLMALGEYEAAKHYILYRDERRRVREESKKISPELKEIFKSGCSYFTGLNFLTQQVQCFDKFSRYRWEWGRREIWPETVDRTVNYFRQHAHEKFPEAISEELWNELHLGLLHHESTPSMRSLQMSGPALERCQTGCYNCAYLEMDSPDSLAEDLYLLMNGVGVGFSVEEEIVDKWTRIKKQSGRAPYQYIVEDDTESWCDSLKFGLYRWIDGEDVEFDTSLIRPRGSVLRTKGGRASGPGPLRDLLNFSRNTILRRQGKLLRTIDIHDMTCMTHRVGYKGGVRRASGISLSSLSDLLMRHAKDGSFLKEHPYRDQANDSAVYEIKPTATEFMEEWLALAKSFSGERGIFNRGSLHKQIPQRRQIRRFGINPCLVGDTPVWVADGRGSVSIRRLADEGRSVPVFCMDDLGKLTIRHMRHPRLTGYQEPIVKVTFDDSCSIRVTRNHRFLMKDGSYCMARDLKPGMSIQLITRYIPESGNIASQSPADQYIFAGCGADGYFEHVMIAEFYYGRLVTAGEHVHHKNESLLDNRTENLEIRRGSIHLLEHSSGGENLHGIKISNEELIEFGRNLVRSLGRRFSPKEWSDTVQSYALPQTFSQWREKSLGSLSAFSRRCAFLEGLDQNLIDVDPRVAQIYKSLILEGMDAEIISGEVFVHKSCENCGNLFTVPCGRREICFCSTLCFQEKRPESQVQSLENRRKGLKEKQLDIYSRLKNRLGREPQREEWVIECGKSGVSTEICEQSSPFVSWSTLTQAGIDYNHRVTAVEDDGFEDVYNGTVDDFHNFCVGGWDGGLALKGKRRQWWCVNAQCGEVILRNKQFCNLTIAISGVHDSVEDLRRKIRLATIWGKIQTTMTRFRYLRPEWKENTEDEALLGVDILGHMDCHLLRPGASDREQLLRLLRQDVYNYDLEWSRRFGVNQGAALTCNKPSGDSSVFFDKPAGFKPHHGRFYLRRLRFSRENPISRVLIDSGVPWEYDYNKSGNIIFEFPCRAPADSMILGDQDAIDQLENWKTWKVNYTEHNPSCFSGDTRFITDTGLRRFGDCRDGESVRVLNAEGRWTDGTIRKLGKQEIWNLNLRLNAVNRTIRTTANHIWPVTYTQARFLGYTPKMYRTDQINGITEKLNMRQLLTVTPHDKPDMDQMAVLHGIVFGDGSPTPLRNEEKGNRLICLYSDRKREDSRKLAPLFVKAGFKQIDRPDVSQIQFYDLPEHWKELPTDLSPTYLRGFMAGWFAADGSISRLSNSIGISSFRKSHLEWLQRYAPVAGLAISTHINAHIGGKSSTTPGKVCYRTTILKSSLDDEFFVHPDKKDKFLVTHHNRRWRLISAESTDKMEPVWCVDVPDGHMFVLEGNILTHNCSIYVKEDEWIKTGNWVYENWDYVGGLSFFPYDGGIYPQAPYQTLSEQEYIQRMATMPIEIDWSRIVLYEESDLTELAGTFACSAGGCEN